jgi:hypothetical protein
MRQRLTGASISSVISLGQGMEQGFERSTLLAIAPFYPPGSC